MALVYYAGHAVEPAQNFLVPVDADLATGNSLIAVSEIVDELARIVPVTILLLDACAPSLPTAAWCCCRAALRR